jgi:hypothetical protein
VRSIARRSNYRARSTVIHTIGVTYYIH